MEHLHSQMINTPVVRIGWPDQFIEHGAVPNPTEKDGITADAARGKSCFRSFAKKSELQPSVAEKAKGASVSESALLSFDGDKPNLSA